MRYFRIGEDTASGYTGTVDGVHRWGLPGLHCPSCGATWSISSTAYPSVDLTSIAALADFVTPRPEPIEEYERMCALVRPFLPPGSVRLEPGVAFGPLVGKAKGHFGPLSSPFTWWVFVQPEALARLQAEGLRGLKGCRTELRFRQRSPPELLELELLPAGRAHPDCLPPDHGPPCSRCGRQAIPLPRELLLDAATLPEHLDVFRLEDFSTVLVCTGRFVDACQRLGLAGLAFQTLPLR